MRQNRSAAGPAWEHTESSGLARQKLHPLLWIPLPVRGCYRGYYVTKYRGVTPLKLKNQAAFLI
jgi:hypothetical protein